MKELAKSIIRDLHQIVQYRNQNPKKVLFDHLPKCGGTTVESYLKSQYRNKNIYKINGRHPQKSVTIFKSLLEATRFEFDLVLGHHAHELVDFVHPDTTFITIFRDPVDRIVSHYYYAKLRTNHYLHDTVTRKNMTLKEYATSGISVELRNWYVSHFLGVSFDEAESRPDWSVTEACRIVKDRYHVIGFLDDLDSAMNLLAKKAGYRKQFQNSYRKKSAIRPKISEIDASAICSIKQVNFLDVELYRRLKNSGK